MNDIGWTNLRCRVRVGDRRSGHEEKSDSKPPF